MYSILYVHFVWLNHALWSLTQFKQHLHSSILKNSAVPDRWDAESGAVALPGWSPLNRTGLQIFITVKTVMIDGRQQRKCVFVVGKDAVVRALGRVEVLSQAGFDRGRAEALGCRRRTIRHPPLRHYQPTSDSQNTTSTNEEVFHEFCVLSVN